MAFGKESGQPEGDELNQGVSVEVREIASLVPAFVLTEHRPYSERGRPARFCQYASVESEEKERAGRLRSGYA